MKILTKSGALITVKHVSVIKNEVNGIAMLYNKENDLLCEITNSGEIIFSDLCSFTIQQQSLNDKINRFLKLPLKSRTAKHLKEIFLT